jgi:hypothetical protein
MSNTSIAATCALPKSSQDLMIRLLNLTLSKADRYIAAARSLFSIF